MFRTSPQRIRLEGCPSHPGTSHATRFEAAAPSALLEGDMEHQHAWSPSCGYPLREVYERDAPPPAGPSIYPRRLTFMKRLNPLSNGTDVPTNRELFDPERLIVSVWWLPTGTDKTDRAGSD
jgi:hypothetical protein